MDTILAYSQIQRNLVKEVCPPAVPFFTSRHFSVLSCPGGLEPSFTSPTHAKYFGCYSCEGQLVLFECECVDKKRARSRVHAQKKKGRNTENFQTNEINLSNGFERRLLHRVPCLSWNTPQITLTRHHGGDEKLRKLPAPARGNTHNPLLCRRPIASLFGSALGIPTFHVVA